MASKESVEGLLGPLEVVLQQRNTLKVYFNPNAEALESNRYVAQISINLESEVIKVIDASSVYNSNASPLEVMDAYTRMAALVRALGFEVVR